MKSDNIHNREGSIGESTNLNKNEADGSALSADIVKAAAKAGLAAAAAKAKLFAGHEEREIQRLSANIVNHQLKRLELKLKQFAEVETMLMKECDQVEKARQRFAAERTRMVSARFGHGGNINSNANNNRPQVMPTLPGQPSISGYGNQPVHPHMPFSPQQPVFGFEQRLNHPMLSVTTSTGLG